VILEEEDSGEFEEGEEEEYWEEENPNDWF
jgi:hypothetical protein